jgi:hypothetical protein
MNPPGLAVKRSATIGSSSLRAKRGNPLWSAVFWIAAATAPSRTDPKGQVQKTPSIAVSLTSRQSNRAARKATLRRHQNPAPHGRYREGRTIPISKSAADASKPVRCRKTVCRTQDLRHQGHCTRGEAGREFGDRVLCGPSSCHPRESGDPGRARTLLKNGRSPSDGVFCVQSIQSPCRQGAGMIVNGGVAALRSFFVSWCFGARINSARRSPPSAASRGVSRARGSCRRAR